jgi:hypothetical protein
MSISIPARPPRDQRLDIVRGWLQLTIFASHAGGSFIGTWLIHRAWGLSDSSELFVFLSGFTLGSVCARRSARDGWRAGAIDILWRAWRLYRINLLVLVLYGTMVTVAGATFLPGEAERLGWGYALTDPVDALPGLLTMLYQPGLMGILPVFVWCMLLLPGFSALEARWGGWALVLPVACYAAVWNFGLAAPSLGPDLEIGFNPFAWQLLFLTGAWLGRRALLFGRALPYDAAWARWVTAAAVLFLVAGLALRLSWYGFIPWHAPVAETRWIVGKEDLALPALLHALALAWLVALMVPRDAPWMYFFPLRAMAAIGRYSLEVFCLGLFLSWGVATVFRVVPGAIVLDPLLIGSGSVLLALFAGWLDRRRRARRIVVTA